MMRIYEQYEVVNFKPAEVAVFIRNGWQLSPGMTGKLCPFFPIGHDRAHRTLFIFSSNSTMESVMRHLDEKVSDIGSWFLFKTFDQIKSLGGFQNSIYHLEQEKNFFEAWRQANGESKTLY